MARPGVMLYFDIIGPIKVLSYEDKGRLLEAILEYGKNGTAPVFDGMLAFAWEFVKPKLDKDGETYENVKLQRRYAAFCKRRSAENLPKIPFEEWLETVYSNEPLRNQRAVTDANNRMLPLPTTTTTTSTATSTTTTPTTTTLSAGDARADFQRLWEAYPQERRGQMAKAWDEFRMEILAPEDADEAMERLKDWKMSEQWSKDGGQYIPYLDNWLGKGIWRQKPKKMAVPKGASGELGEAELEAIRRILAQDMEE